MALSGKQNRPLSIIILLGLVISPLLLSVQALAARDKLLDSQDLGQEDAKSLLSQNFSQASNLHHFDVSEAMLISALTDQDDRIDQIFDYPTGTDEHVHFWLRIYTQYSSLQTVIYDTQHPELIYEVMDFRPLKDRTPNAIRFEILRKKQIEKRFKEVKNILSRLQKGQKTRNALEKRIAKLIRPYYGKHHQHTFAQMIKGMRTQTGQRDHVINGLYRSKPFWQTMETIFEQLDVPHELVTLSLLESSFNTEAHSRSGAIGVWQFLKETGSNFLLIHPGIKVDERKSPLKSTVAAARLLKENKQAAGNWPYAIVAYNSGFRFIRRIPKPLRSIELLGQILDDCSAKSYDLSKKKNYRMGFASKNYYFEFLALLRAVKYQDIFYGDFEHQFKYSITFKELDRRQSMSQFAFQEGYNLLELRKLNPDVLNPNQVLPAGFWIAAHEPYHDDQQSHQMGGLTSKQWLSALQRLEKAI